MAIESYIYTNRIERSLTGGNLLFLGKSMEGGGCLFDILNTLLALQKPVLCLIRKMLDR